MKKLLGLFFCLFASSAHAGFITETQTQTVDFQTFNFQLLTPNYVAGTSSILTLTLQGDFNSSSERVDSVSLEGNDLGPLDFDTAGVYDLELTDDLPSSGNGNGYRFSYDFLLDSATTSSLLVDGILEVSIALSDSVHEQFGWWTINNGVREGQAPFASVAFSYQSTPVSEPASLAVFGLALLGLGLSRKRKLA